MIPVLYVQVSSEVVFQLFVSQVFISFKDSPIQTFQTQFEKINKEMYNIVRPFWLNIVVTEDKRESESLKVKTGRQSEWKMCKILKWSWKENDSVCIYLLCKYSSCCCWAEPP